ncbi:acetamidase/formamidase family protein [Kribbella sp. NPDC003505]|uniref:acetamidase/formamidase family protein n=1 Tax=Kribbella sp. NPDC003505 TaxID=3154448 RepID=UPI0033A9DF1F
MDPIAAPPVDLDCHGLPDAAILQPGRRTRIRTWPGSDYPFLTGPLRVEGVSPGDTLAFHLHALELDPVGHYGFATTTNPREPWGGVLRKSASQEYAGRAELRGDRAILDGQHVLPVVPMLGWLGLVRPELIADSWDHGGNLDTKEFAPGSILYLYDETGSGRFVIGDAHAAMGDGEISGQGIEIASWCDLTVEIVPATSPHRPIVQTPDAIVHLCSRFTEKDAYTQAISDAAHHLRFTQQIGFERANAILSLIADLRVSSVVSHSPTYKLLVPSSWLGPIEDLLTVEKPLLPYTPR